MITAQEDSSDLEMEDMNEDSLNLFWESMSGINRGPNANEASCCETEKTPANKKRKKDRHSKVDERALGIAVVSSSEGCAEGVTEGSGEVR